MSGEDIQRSLLDGEEASPRASALPEKHQFCSPSRAVCSLYPLLSAGAVLTNEGKEEGGRGPLLIGQVTLLVMFSLTTGALDGETGTGKTLSLCHVIHFCAKQDWLILHIPDGKKALSSLLRPGHRAMAREQLGGARPS